MPGFKVVSISFTLYSTMSPFHIIDEVERFFGKKDCVISLQAFSGERITCTFCDVEIANRILAGKEIRIGGRRYPYKLVETNIIGIKIERPPHGVSVEDINRILRQYGRILKSERDKNRSYIAVIDLLRDIPGRLSIRHNFCEVVELKD